jgi:PhnB protein
MKQLGIYLTFQGNCKEALNFYKSCLGGEIVSMQTFGESPMKSDEKDKDLVIHSEFKAEEIKFMASDTMPGHDVNSGNQVTLSINLTDEKEQKEIFDKLSAGGKINMPLEDTFWGAKFGMLTDKYGINWMLNCEKAKQ